LPAGKWVSPLIASLALALALVAGACGGDDGEKLRIVFDSERTGNQDIFVMRDDGTEVRQLTDNPGRDYEPNASDDGSMIVFVSDRFGGKGAQLYLMKPDGTEVRRLTFSDSETDTVVDDYPHWSPDGRAIVFQRTTASESPSSVDADIWLVDIQTGDESQVTDTPDAWDSTPSFSSDGRFILFESNRDGNFDLHRLDLETSSVENLTGTGGTNVEASESPDGRQIAFASRRDGDFEIYVSDSDGGNIRKLTDNEMTDRCPHWSPDGRLIAFISDRDGDREIYVMNADGSGVHRLTIAPGNDEVPNWLVES
jgi:TolB protein